MDIVATANAALTTVAKTLDYFKSNVAGHFSDTSMTAITKLTRAEPLTLISKDCANLAYLPDVLNTLAGLYSAYYLQTVAILTRVNDIEVVKILDRLNPDRDSTGFLLAGRLAQESAYNGIRQDLRFSLPTKAVFVREAEDHTTAIAGKEAAQTLYEANNLIVGKLLNVAISVPTDDGESTKTVNVPVSVRLAPALLPQDTIGYIFSHRAQADGGLIESWYAAKAGRQSFIRDGIFAQNLIDEYRKAAIQDKTGTLQEIVRRATNARSYGVLTKNPSLAISSNLYVLSKPVAQFIEQKVGTRFNTAAGREKLLKGTYAMVVAIIDSEREMVEFYFRGIDRPSVVSVRSLAAASKNKNGVDITDVMRSLLEGKTPSF